MIEASHSTVILSPIDQVWDYVKEIEQWAELFPGCRECETLNADESRWIIKVGAGGLIKTVSVHVHVNSWNGPEKVDFTFKLENEPVEGSGFYRAKAIDAGQTQIEMEVKISGSGSMAPMWEAVSKPLLPQLAKSFASSLKAEIEKEVHPPAAAAPTQLWRWLKNLWRALPGREPEHIAKMAKEIAMLEEYKKTVTTFIHAMSTGDSATAARCLTADAITIAKGFGHFSGVREYETIIATIKAFTQLFPEGLKPDIKTITAESERVIVEFEGKGKTSTGTDYHNQYCMVFTMRDGKIRQVNEYFCNKLADDVLWPLISQMPAGES